MGDTGSPTPVTQDFPGGCLERERMHRECFDNTCFPFLNHFIRKSFKRLPTTIEWVRFRKYTQRMRELALDGNLDVLSLEALSVLRFATINEHLPPNLKILRLWEVREPFIRFISLFLSPGITSISLAFESNVSKAMIASTVKFLPTLCPKLQAIQLCSLPRDPMITAAVSEMLLATSRNTLQKFCVDSPLTKETSEVVYRLPNLCNLSVVIEGESSLSSASLPNLTHLTIACDNEDDWPRLFRGATFGKLESVTFYPESKGIGDFLGAFEKAALSSSVQDTLSTFHISMSSSWNPNYSSLLPFTHLVHLSIGPPCEDECSSRVDDDIVIDLSRAMPKLQVLQLGGTPCNGPMTGVTAKGLGPWPSTARISKTFVYTFFFFLFLFFGVAIEKQRLVNQSA